MLRRFAFAAVPLSLIAFLLVIGRGSLIGKNPEEKEKSKPLPRYAELVTAKNAVRLHLQDDGIRLLGWVSGEPKNLDAVVTIKVGANGRFLKVPVREDRSFEWEYRLDKPTDIEVSMGSGKETLKQEFTVMPMKLDTEPSVFFVVDRTAYRPGQSIMFAGFLRKLSAKSEFEPIPNTEVEVSLVSQQKKTIAGKFKLRSDERGKIEGAYTFSEHDALDNYNLSVTGYKGNATVFLGEYRKSKIKLQITGEMVEKNLNVKFETLDFLDKAVDATKLHFDIQVVQRNTSRAKKQPLKAEDFVHHLQNLSLNKELEEIPEEDRLLWLADHVFPMSLGIGRGVIATYSYDVNLKGKEPHIHPLTINPAWKGEGYEVIVQGIVTDATGREQRSTKSIPLDLGKSTTSVSQVVIAKETYAVDELIPVRLVSTDGKAETGATTLVVMKLSPDASGGAYGYYDPYFQMNYLPIRSSYSSARMLPRQVNPEGAKRTLMTAVPFKDDAASIRIQEPGAYKLVAVTHRPDGTSVRSEVGCVVSSADALNPMMLLLESEYLNAGDTLRGEIYSRFANARVLMTIRDSGGFRLVKSIKLDDQGHAKLAEKLPARLKYGCIVELCYYDTREDEYTCSKFLRVAPTDQMLTVKSTVKEEVSPGETVKLDLQVNREEEVDLIVSVYDQALLGIAPDRGVNISDFYLADERVRTLRLRDRIKQDIGNITLAEILKRAKALLKDPQEGDADNIARQQLQQIVTSIEANHYVYAHQLIGMMRLAGVEIQINPMSYARGTQWYIHTKPEMKLKDVLDMKHNEFTLAFDVVGDRLVMQDWHPSYSQYGASYYARLYSPYGRRGYPYYQQMGMYESLNFGGRGARGDSHWSISGNSAPSFLEGQAVFSHVPVSQPVQLIETGADQGNIYIRRDFSDSAYWNARVKTNPLGKASVEFKVPDSLTNWQVAVTAVSKKMHVGQTRSQFRTFKPIMVWPMLPRVFTQGDRMDIFATVHNRTDQEQEIDVRLKVENGEILSRDATKIKVPAKSSVPVYWSFKPNTVGFTQLLMSASCPAGSDASLKRLPVMRSTVEEVFTASGRVKDLVNFKLPAEVDLNSASMELNFAPSLAADMADTLNYLVDYPYGCVEQTMSRFLPAIKVAQVLRNFQIDHPTLNEKLPLCVSGGMKRLLELQQPDGGWGWHGTGQTHEMMTPYALFGLLQAEKAGYTIPSEDAVSRGLVRLKQFIDQMGENQASDRIYCMYVYSHRFDLPADWFTWIETLATNKRLSDYALALALEMSVEQKKKELASKLADALRKRATQDGTHVYWTTAKFSRWGEDRFEITAAAMKALVAYDVKDPLIDGILSFFAATKRGDRWNSTKDTAMIVYAICDLLAKEQVGVEGNGKLVYQLNGGKDREVEFKNQLTQRVTSAATTLKSGTNELKFKTEMRGVMYRLVVRYWKEGNKIPAQAKGITVKRQFWLLNDQGGIVRELKDGDTVPRGSYILSRVEANSQLASAMNYVLVENPKPSSCEILPATDRRFVNYHDTHHVLREERNGSVAFHHDHVGTQIIDHSVLLAELSGEFVVPPAWVELMYQTEVRGHSGTFSLKVEEKK
jgi:hypothetical protein